MPDHFVDAFVEKLILLEGANAAPPSAQLFAPNKTPFADVLAIQAAAKALAKSIGLDGFTFIIAVAKQKINTGGHIDLSTRGKEVFIEIDKDVMKFPEAVWATLCHELCHKWLQTHGLPSAHIEIENEILTDIATIYLGFGKIMLNGCESERSWTEYIANGTRTHTETMNVGYLKLDQLAFVYRLVCSMRSIPDSDSMGELNSKALGALRRCDSEFGHHYDLTFHEIGAGEGIVRSFQDRLTALQHSFSNLNKHAAYVRVSFCNTSEEFFKSGHRKMDAFRQKVSGTPISPGVGPIVRFLKAIQKKQEIERLRADAHALERELEGFLSTAAQLGLSLSRNSTQFPTPAADIFRIVACPKDETKLRLPAGPGPVTVRCPTCKYQFVYNMNALTFNEACAPKKLTWKEKLFKLFRR